MATLISSNDVSAGLSQLTIINTISITSYNLHGLTGQGTVLLNDLCSASKGQEIIFVQEHWLTPTNMHCIKAFSPNYTVYGVSAMEQAVSHSVLRGRPYGGVATLIHKDFSTRASCVKCAERYIITVID